MKQIVLILIYLMSTTILYGYEKAMANSAFTLFNKWQFIGFQDVSTGEKDFLPENIKVTIEFRSSINMRGPRPHNFIGKGPCNRYYGIFETKNKNRLIITTISATKVACEGRMEWEIRYFNALRKAESYEIKNHEMRISFNKNNEIMLYKLANN